MSWGDTARIDGGWSADPSVVAICSEADCPVAGARIVICRDDQGRYVATWTGGQVALHAELDRDRREYVSREGVEGVVHRVRPVRPEPRREAYLLWLRVVPEHNPPGVRTPYLVEPVVEAREDEPVRNDF